ncbi:hypothetical protein B2J86_00560 [Acidovorax sp. SRB_14]|uniref:hypothetical protein n=1 Tax=Acidovorax sp. SRB_14 TaxID=1962699 RepID=UPI001EBD14D0|nr:hypothetical protein [Acidovorax sp. SRB_14]NMM79434.1 hypothetical protein [Acidovorax sp. SRB_14]
MPSLKSLQTAPASRRHTRWLWCLLLALLLAPTLGQMHRVLHGAHLPGAVSSSAASALQAAGGDTASFVSILFAGHSPAECQLLDQLALGDGPHGAAPALLHPLPEAWPGAGPQPHLRVRRIAAFQARAPPRA